MCAGPPNLQPTPCLTKLATAHGTQPAADRPRGLAEAAGATPGTLESVATAGPGRSVRGSSPVAGSAAASLAAAQQYDW